MNLADSPLVALLEEIDRAGLSLRLEGERIACAPARALTAELQERILRHRDELVEALRSGEPVPARHEHAGDLESVSWRLSPDGPGWAVVRSELLGSPILFIRDSDVLVPADLELVTYTRAELEILATATSSALRDIHAAKRVFGGTVTALNALSSAEPGRLNA